MELKALMSTKETMSSLQIAEITGKQHSHIMRDIRNLASKGVRSNYFLESEYTKQLPNKGTKSMPYYVVSKECASLLNMNYKNENLSKFVGQQYIGTITRFEHSFGELLKTSLSKFDLEIISQYKVGKYKVDFYIKELNAVIEYDDAYHDVSTNFEYDSIREEYIKNLLNCKFIRLDYRQSDAENLSVVLKRLLSSKK